MNYKSEKGGVRAHLALFLPVLAVLCYFGFALAQSAADDPCAIYPHQSAIINLQTATASVVVGTSGTQIYVCQISLSAAAGTPGFAGANVQLWYGNASTATPTPCWTGGTAGAVELGVFSVSVGTGTTFIGADGLTTILGPVPAATTTPTNTTSFPSLCALTTTVQNLAGGIVTYVQVKP